MPTHPSSRAALVYETDDSAFADSAIEALTRAGIECYRTGGSLPGGASPAVCIYIRNAGDYQKANEVLVQQGAAIDDRRISPRVLVTRIILAALVGALIVVGAFAIVGLVK